ncbi:MAG: hypothetical protein P1V97_01920 [Planctomycetota bacterium]|nr:hypothetical protein [Planctomycetota bacterium]
MKPTFILLLSTLLLSGCIFPRTTVSKPGKLLLEKQEPSNKLVNKLDMSYDYPDLRVTFKSGTIKTWNERYGTPKLQGELQYSLWGDCQEIVLGGPLFASGILTFGADLVVFRYRPQSVDNMLFLLALSPAIQHTEMASEPEIFTPTNVVDWGAWRVMKRENYKTPEKKTINFVSAKGTVLYQIETNSNGEAFADIREIYGLLFKGPEQAVKVVELVSGSQAALPKTLNSNAILEEVKRAGDEATLNSGADLSQNDE